MDRETFELEGEDLAYARALVRDGHFASVAETVAAALDLLRDEWPRVAALRALLREGEESGPAQPFDFDAFIARKQAARGTRHAAE